jgi:Na+/H+-dicarboxylate symporter
MGVDHFLDMGRSATNVIGNSLAAAVVATWEGELDPAGADALEEKTLDALAGAA